jgi:hypothetical protein
MKRIFEEHTTVYFRIYYLLLILMVISLPLSKALASIVPGLLMFNWIVERKFVEKFNLLRQRKGLMLLISIYFIYLLGLLWTSSLEWGMVDVTIQLPLFVLPLVIGTSPGLNYRQVKRIIYFFAAAVVVASLCSVWVLLGLSGFKIRDPREMSIFISHIRFSLLINIAIFSLGWYVSNSEEKRLQEKLLLIFTIVWLSIFLVILKSVTGWAVFFLVSLVVVFRYILRVKKLSLKLSLFACLFTFSLAPVVYTLHIVRQFYSVEKIPANITQEKTRLGNRYSVDLHNKELENGHYIYLYINEDELRDAWNKRSKFNYDSTYASGFNRFVLIRYLTSKGYRKDAEGAEKLSDTDISNIENGMTNYRFVDSYSFYKRIYQINWEIDSYLKGGNPSGHSVTQRLEYYKMALAIIGKEPWFGHGTGGYYLAYQEEYNKNKFFPPGIYRQRSHNMILSYLIDFGLIGAIYICFALVAPVFIENKRKSALLIIFLLIVFISFINEDSLNNHDAISFFAFFYPLYLFSDYEKPEALLNLPEGEL